MAGDHKCSVCQVTFTRPQDASRHMRTHTGDRPYQCQHCGDQFPRSNILSGHINKCHPNENPLVFSTPSRRKGTSSASRAATSKHACADPFFLANNGSALSQSTASSNPLYADHQFTFPPPQVPAIPYDYSVRYRAQAYILAHMGVIPPERPPPLPAIYQKSQAPHDPTTAARYSQSFPLNNDHQDYPLSPSPNGVGYGYNIDNKSEYPNNVLGYSANGYNPHYPSTFNHDTQIHQCRESSASDTSSTTSRSQTSSASSSSVHLPLTVDYSQQQSYSRPPSAHGVVQDREGFYSAFGLMSLDDPEVLAGLSDGPPFFDHAITSHNPWEDGPTPRANPCGAPPANGKKRAYQQWQQQDLSYGHAGNVPAGTPANLKELEEMWKLYKETPSSGQPLADERHPAGSPKCERGTCGVNGSLPQPQQQQQQANGTNNTQHGEHAAYSRVYNHTDDLRSYEQAVLARRAPLTLHLPPRRHGHTTLTGPPVTPSPPHPASSTTAPPPGEDNKTRPAGTGSGSDGTNNTQRGGHAAYSRVHNHTDDLRSYEQAVLARRAPLTLPRRHGHTTLTGPPVTPSPPPPASSTTALPPGKGNKTRPAGTGSGSDRSMNAFTDDRWGSYAGMDMDSLRASVDPTQQIGVYPVVERLGQQNSDSINQTQPRERIPTPQQNFISSATPQLNLTQYSSHVSANGLPLNGVLAQINGAPPQQSPQSTPPPSQQPIQHNGLSRIPTPPDTLHPILSCWIKNMNKLSGLIDRLQELASVAPAEHQSQLLRQVVALRTTFKKQQDHCMEFLTLSDEYANKYLLDISDEIQRQSTFLDKLEERLEAAKKLRREAVDLQMFYESETVATMKKFRATALPRPLAEDYALFNEVDLVLAEIRQCYMELDKFWTEEIFRAIEALKMRRVDPTDFERWKSFHANLKQTIESWKDELPSGDAQILRHDNTSSSKEADIGAIASSMSSAMKSLTSALEYVTSSNSLKYLRSDAGRSFMQRVYVAFAANSDLCFSFLQKCADYGGKAIGWPLPPIALPTSLRVMASHDLRERTMRLRSEMTYVENAASVQGSRKFKATYNKALSLEQKTTSGLKNLLEKWVIVTDGYIHPDDVLPDINTLEQVREQWEKAGYSVRAALAILKNELAPQLFFRSAPLASTRLQSVKRCLTKFVCFL